jgi:hypothetical protein
MSLKLYGFRVFLGPCFSFLAFFSKLEFFEILATLGFKSFKDVFE